MEIKNDMAGKVIEVLVNKGDSVNSGDDLVCLESMKMQMYISSEDSGTVKDVMVKEGDFVNGGEILITLE